MTLVVTKTLHQRSNTVKPLAADQEDSALWKRCMSAALLVPTTLWGVYLGGASFAGLVAFLTVIMLFEWAQMVERRPSSGLFFVLSLFAIMAFIAAGYGYWRAAALLCLAGGVAGGLAAMHSAARMGWSAFGSIYIIGPALMLIWLRQEAEYALALTLTVFLIVWMADSGAYFAGRFIGGPRISKALSPSKTWSGVAAGIVMGALAGAIAFKWIYGEGYISSFVGLGAALGLASILGDLAESAFKRIFGVKDSSQLIPGHGGFLDRLDGMIFAVTAMTGGIFVHMILANW